MNSVSGTFAGMYIAELDRPWLDTPYSIMTTYNSELPRRNLRPIERLELQGETRAAVGIVARRYVAFVQIDNGFHNRKAQPMPDAVRWVLRERLKHRIDNVVRNSRVLIAYRDPRPFFDTLRVSSDR